MFDISYFKHKVKDALGDEVLQTNALEDGQYRSNLYWNKTSPTLNQDSICGSSWGVYLLD